MSYHLIKTLSQQYPPFTGEFLCSTKTYQDHSWEIHCPPLAGMTLSCLGGDAEEVLTEYCSKQNVQLLQYWPVIKDQNITELPATDGQPKCFINCKFAEHLADEMNRLFANCKYYNCRLPAAYSPVLRLVVILNVCTAPDNRDRWREELQSVITPEAVKELIENAWPQYDLKVSVQT